MGGNDKIRVLLNEFRKNLVFLLLFSPLFAPVISGMVPLYDSTGKGISDLKAKAIRYDRNKEVYNAIEYYSRYLSYGVRDIKSAYRLATLCSETRDYKKAEQYFDTVVSINQRKYSLAWYRRGMACMSLEKYDKAIESFTKFKKYYNKKKDKQGYRKLTAIYLSNCAWAKNNMGRKGNIIVTHPGDPLNHSDIDFSPFPVDDSTIIYGAIYNNPSKQTGSVRQLYKAQKLNGKWETPGLLEGGINDPGFNTGNAVLSEDGQSLFFTRTRKNWSGKSISEIFVSHSEGGQWQKAEKLPYPINREDCTSTQPALGKNLKTGNYILYFVSDRPGGKGRLDIWYTEYNAKTGTYKTVISLPNKVNSVGDEFSPFYDIATQTLYFSSRGRKNAFGGFDIYKSKGSAGKWTDGVPLPEPINSSFDDYYFTSLKNNREGYFSSNRPGTLTLENGTCCDDVYSFKILECVGIFSHGTVRNDVNYAFYDALNKKYGLGLKYPENNSTISDVPLELYLNDENDNDELLISKTTTGKNGNFTFDLEQDRNYKILVKNYGYFETKVPVSTFNTNCSDTVDLGTYLIKYLPRVTIRINVYYDFDKYKLTDASRETIDNMLMPLFDMFPAGIIEIGSHTDGIGTDQYNMDLSQKRSESIVSYLISKGIPGERLVARGYGMRIPIAPNSNPDGSDNPEGRQLNRRTEIKVVGETPTLNSNQ